MPLRNENLWRIQIRTELIVRMFKQTKAKTVLDVGCGAGEQTQLYLAKLPHLEVTAIEPNQHDLNITKQKLEKYKIRVYKTTFEEFNPKKEKWDIALLSDVIEHSRNPIQFLKKATELAPYILVIVANAKSLNRIIGVELGIIPHLGYLTEDDKKVGHKRIYTNATFRSLVKRCNLEIIEQGGIWLKPMPDSVVCKWSRKTQKLLYELGKQHMEIAGALYYLLKKRVV